MLLVLLKNKKRVLVSSCVGIKRNFKVLRASSSKRFNNIFNGDHGISGDEEDY